LITSTTAFSRVFTREDGRDRIALPFWSGLFSVLAAIAIGLAVSFVVTMVLVFGTVLVYGRAPSTAPGHLVVGVGEVVFYLGAGWFAWRRLRQLRPNVFRRLQRNDLRVLWYGLAALLLVKIGTAVQLMLAHQSHHVQSGFEHFSVVARSPLITALSVGITVLTLVVLGPIVEEVVFRGLLFGALARPLGVILSALVSAVLFGAGHGDLVLFPSLAALGFIGALAYAATGNLAVAVLLHAINNAFGALFLIVDSIQPR
jgi:membrane protease YdiL (CAAX protease family)